MQNVNSTHKWWVDALVFSGFLILFSLDLTGVSLHQWLGVGVCVLAVYHLLIHWPWVKSVAARFTSKTSSQARQYFLLDLLLGIGFLTMLVTGLVISTWFNLSLDNFYAWKNVHVIASIGSLSVLLIKIGLHWRWIASTTRKVFARRASAPVAVASRVNASEKVLDRREFIKIMAPATLLTAVAVSGAVKAIQTGSLETLATGYVQAASGVTDQSVQQVSTQVSSTSTAEATSAVTTQPTQAAVQATSTPQAVTACSYSCRKGNHCSYPGRCHDYRDSNGNGLCDLGECL